MQHGCFSPVLLRIHKLLMLREAGRSWAPALSSSDTRTNRHFPERGLAGPVRKLHKVISAQGDHRQLRKTLKPVSLLGTATLLEKMVL